MEPKITWNSGLLDEISLVYEKAEENEAIGRQLSQLEDAALAELRTCAPQLSVDGKPLTAEQVDAMSGSQREQLIVTLGKAGIAGMNAPLTEPVITVRFTPVLPQLMGCAIFVLLNSLEKLDGAYNVRFPKATLALQVPLGGKKGLFQYEMLIMQLYPWLSVKETSSDQAAITEPPAPRAQEPAQAAPAAQTERPTEPAAPEKKPGFFAKLFGKK